ncbi:hypothetical protein EBR66_03185 [bacterium]|nr:hypothetical protein [bacterium]
MIFDFKLTFPKWLARVFGAPKTRKNRGANQRSGTNTRPLMNIVRNMYGLKTNKNGLKTNRNATKRNGTNRNGTNENGTNGGTNNDPGILVNNDSAKRGNNLYNKIYAPKKTSGQRFLNAYEKRQRNAEQRNAEQRNAEQRERNARRRADPNNMDPKH